MNTLGSRPTLRATGAIAGLALTLTGAPSVAATAHHTETARSRLAASVEGAPRAPSPARLAELRRHERWLQAHHQPAPRFPARSAAVFHVDTTEDSGLADASGKTCVDAATGACSLRAAVDAANNLAAPAKVVLGAKTYVLVDNGIAVTNPSGTSIVGRGRQRTTVSTTASGSVISEVGAEDGPTAPLLFLSALTVTGGNGAQGGGLNLVDDSFATAVLDGVRFTGNVGVVGGGLRAGSQSKLYARNTTFLRNIGAAGAGLVTSQSDVDLTNVTIADNHTMNGFIGSGAGWENEGSVARMHGGSITGNAAGDGITGAFGGGLFDLGSSTTLTDVHVDGNTASSPGAHGGGILAVSSVMDVDGGSISRNQVAGDSTASGGGVYSDGAQLGLHGVTMTSDRAPDTVTAPYGGGAIFNFANGEGDQITLDRGTSIAHANAGAVYAYATSGQADFDIEHARLAHNVSTSGNGPSGQGCGAICGYAASDGALNLTLANDTLSDNAETAPAGLGSGAIGVFSNGDSARVDLTRTTFTGNIAGGHGLGGALGVTGSSTAPVSVRLAGNTFAHNRVGSDSEHGFGGAIGIEGPAAAFSDTGSTFSHNQAIGDDAYGGAVYSDSQQTSRFTRTTFTANSAGPATGGAGHGGAVFVNDSRGTSFSQVSVVHNHAAADGGGISSGGSGYSVSLEESTIAANTAGSSATSGNGGGIDAYDSVLAVENSTITQNRTLHGTDGLDALGGGIYSGGGTLGLRYSTVVGNLAENGGGVWSEIPAGSLLGTVISANHDLLGHEQDCGAHVDRAVLHSLGGNVLGAGTCVTALGSRDRVTSHPRLLPLRRNGGPTKTMALRPTSPAIGLGTYLCPVADQRGRQRPATRCDAGAFELPHVRRHHH